MRGLHEEVQEERRHGHAEQEVEDVDEGVDHAVDSHELLHKVHEGRPSPRRLQSHPPLSAPTGREYDFRHMFGASHRRE